MGFIDTRVTSPGVGVSVCERVFGVTKRIKYGHRAKLTSVKTKKISRFSTTKMLKKAIINGEALEELYYKDNNSLWGVEDEGFDIGLKKFGVDIGYIHEAPTGPERIFCCWPEDWKNTLRTLNRAESKLIFIQK